MKRGYTKVQHLAEEVFRRKKNGETHREIGERLGLNQKQIKELVNRERRKS